MRPFFEGGPTKRRPPYKRQNAKVPNERLQTNCRYPPWPNRLERQTMYNAEIGIERSVSISRRRRPHFAPTQNGVRICSRNRTNSAQRPAQVSCQWTEGTVSLSTAQTIGHVKPSDKITARTGKFQCAIPESPPTISVQFLSEPFG